MRSAQGAALGVVLCVFGVASGAAFADFFTDWSASDVLSVADNVDTNIDDGRDITNVYYRHVGTTNYLRMDLRGAPIPPLGAEKAPDYMMHMLAIAGGASPGDGSTNTQLSEYVAVGLNGIDEIVDGHLATEGTWRNHHHLYVPGTNVYNFDDPTLQSQGGKFQSSENGGATLEWAVPDGLLQSASFVVYPSTQQILSGATWDTAPALMVNPPAVQITALAVGSNVLMQCTGTNNWVPVPWVTTNLLAGGGGWVVAPVHDSSYPALTGGEYTVWFALPTNNTEQQLIKVVSTNAP